MGSHQLHPGNLQCRLQVPLRLKSLLGHLYGLHQESRQEKGVAHVHSLNGGFQFRGKFVFCLGLPCCLSDSTSCSGADSVRPDPGLKLPGPRPISNANKGLIHRRQASSTKLQAPSSSNLKRQASSPKHKGSSAKPQAASSWTLLPGKSFKHL